ncbi:hypothetical protein B7494_g6399 [Chlorociboria aeruginascens]|nr:hypothetical protein B7494_g6399 [Chlorociboria aeruginascens]
MTSRVVSSSFIKNITKGSESLGLRYATKTVSWERPSAQPSASVKEGFSSAMETFSDSKVPAAAVDAVMVETEHPSQKDNYPHYTFVFHDKDGNEIAVEHAYP